MSNTNRGWIGVIVGLAVGMSIGAAVAVPAAQQYFVSITDWPANLNVTLTNPPTIPTPPADSDGDSVPDTLDAFPTNPSISRLYSVDTETNGSSGSLSMTVTCDLIFGASGCVVPFVPQFLSITWNVTAFSSFYSFQIRTEGLQRESGSSCSPSTSTFSSDQSIGTYTKGFPPVVMFISGQSQGFVVGWWECFSGIRIDLLRGGTAYPDSYLIANVEFVA